MDLDLTDFCGLIVIMDGFGWSDEIHCIRGGGKWADRLFVNEGHREWGWLQVI